MLKRKLVKAGFFGHGALFIMVSPFSVSPKAQTPGNEIALSGNPSVHQMMYKDTKVQQATDTVVLSAAEAGPAAPKTTMNALAAKYAGQFIKKNTEALEIVEKRSGVYFNIIEPIFKNYDLPVELKYLAVVESQLKASALSHAGARGPWQLMASTARDLGLKVNGKRDERTQYYKSTVAAAKHLKVLYNEFGDWLLVIAAYNSGSGPVLKAIKRSGSHNFWKLQAFLPAETRGHVKRFIATHYYFQQEGSLTMLTKAETHKYLKEISDYKVKQNLQMDENTIIAVR
jgi:membrane-bound lytic murein transglycosylase D